MKPNDLYSNIRAALVREPPAEIRSTRRRGFSLLAIVLLVVAVDLAVSQLVYHRSVVGLSFGIRSTSSLLVASSMLVALVVASSWIVLDRGKAGLGAGVVLLSAMTVLVPLLSTLVVLPNPVHLPDAVPKWVDISPWGMRCALIATAVGAIVLVGFSHLLRRAVPAAHGLRSLAIGAAAGAWAALAVFAFCPSGEQRHLLIGHVLPVLVLTAFGGFIVGRRLRP